MTEEEIIRKIQLIPDLIRDLINIINDEDYFIPHSSKFFETIHMDVNVYIESLDNLCNNLMNHDISPTVLDSLNALDEPNESNFISFIYDLDDSISLNDAEMIRFQSESRDIRERLRYLYIIKQSKLILRLDNENYSEIITKLKKLSKFYINTMRQIEGSMRIRIFNFFPSHFLNINGFFFEKVVFSVSDELFCNILISNDEYMEGEFLIISVPLLSDDTSERSLEWFMKFVDDLFISFEIKIKKFRDLPVKVQNQLEYYKNKNSKLCYFDKEWIEKYRNSLKSLPDFNLAFNRCNIFIGPNNSGKTHTLDIIFDRLSSGNFNSEDFKNGAKLTNIKSLYTSKNIDAIIETYCIPTIRRIEGYSGQTRNLVPDLKRVLAIFKDHRFKNWLRSNDPWSIKDLAYFIRTFRVKFSYDYDTKEFSFEENITPQDKDFIKIQWNFMLYLRKIYKSWKNAIRDIFEDEIRIIGSETYGQAGDFKITTKLRYYDDIDNWTLLGSGSKELINLIFFIEYLKHFPAINYDKFLDLLNPTQNVNTEIPPYQDWPIISIKPIRFLFIDEPELSLHPSILRRFFLYLIKASKYIQLFIATQSPLFVEMSRLDEFLCNDLSIHLFKKGSSDVIQINKKNKILIYEELYDYSPKEVAILLYKDEYKQLMYSSDEIHFKYKELPMIWRLINYCVGQTKKLIQLGTHREDPSFRFLYNVHFLIQNPKEVNLNLNSMNPNNLKSIYICQMHESSQLDCSSDTSEIKYFIDFINKNWKVIKSGALTYNDNTKRDSTIERLNHMLEKIKDSDVVPYETLLIFPENSIPYEYLNKLINFAESHKILIVGGLEHCILDDLSNYIENLKEIHENKLIDLYDYESLYNQVRNVKKKRIRNQFINQAIIINADQGISFQIKNIPVTRPKREPINIITIPKYRKFQTIIGNLSIMICKDLLVNYSVIDKWMKLYKIQTILIPSFTPLVDPFRHKLGEITRTSGNENLCFIFSNVGGYGGSGIFTYGTRKEYEPRKGNICYPEENIYKFSKDQKEENKWNFNSNIVERNT